jgi:hypothetical protein
MRAKHRQTTNVFGFPLGMAGLLGAHAVTGSSALAGVIAVGAWTAFFRSAAIFGGAAVAWWIFLSARHHIPQPIEPKPHLWGRVVALAMLNLLIITDLVSRGWHITAGVYAGGVIIEGSAILLLRSINQLWWHRTLTAIERGGGTGNW